MHRPPPGQYVTLSTADEPYQAFVPAPLPPVPPLAWTPALRRRFDDALVALGRLDAITALLPNAALLLYSFVRKEAVLSSQIEGTQSSLADLLLFEIDEQPGVPLDDAHEVSRYVAALERGLALLRGGLPLCSRLLCEMHAVLLDHPRGRGKAPGEIRSSAVWIGGSRPGNAAFVPPPVDALPACIAAFERFLNDDPEATSPLLKAALAHVQFQTIHPFLDGNGRIGRLLIVLQLVADGVLREPLLYPSLFFKTHRSLYYELLNEVRLRGDWERWLDFFAEGVQASAAQALVTAHALLALVNADRDRIATLGRAASSALVVHQALQRQPLATSTALVKAAGLTAATVNKSLGHLSALGIVAELTQRQRGRVFSYRRYVELLNADLPPAAA
ncbi:MAG: Adenosine monophosphate-protein transferase SoFic [Candidatus Accumulibacter regalis]|uniref:Adenosine monophosphate-protein transferase SoFic n=1 Tax=Accumulibacter regalis TaxID=522306 RepID=A0A011RFY9_ACCRE|nr:Fic family protein [Accumulibacter sp.]EXI90134.1 MAG: Adenosine monophosphate-protein transferase SoFic [Candidatus Accumulibacter regalis]HRE72076.1 Fic family protein [Accumulibacter sp.]